MTRPSTWQKWGDILGDRPPRIIEIQLLDLIDDKLLFLFYFIQMKSRFNSSTAISNQVHWLITWQFEQSDAAEHYLEAQKPWAEIMKTLAGNCGKLSGEVVLAVSEGLMKRLKVCQTPELTHDFIIQWNDEIEHLSFRLISLENF